MSILRTIAGTSLLDLKRLLQKKLKERNRNKISEKIFNEYLKSNSLKKLHLGAGTNLLDEWLNTDISYNNEVAFLNAADIFPFKNDTFDYVFSEHLIEHLNFDQQIIMLKESYRVLKVGGKVRVVTPNFDFLISLYKNKTEINRNYINWTYENFLQKRAFKTDEYRSNAIFVINNFMRDWGHKFIHNKESIIYMLSNIGFTNIKEEEINKSENRELSGIEQHGGVIPKEFNEIESMVFVAQKK